MSPAEKYASVKTNIKVPFPPKGPIQCLAKTPHAKLPPASPSLIFTHGSGGTLESDAIANFSEGFGTQKTIFCFEGNMKLNARTKMFDTVCQHLAFSQCLGGRSMGARAAVMTVTDKTEYLVLVSYPLHTGQQTRDQILLDLPASLKVLFVIGEKDSMCNMERLNAVRKRMKCETWLVVVQAADHGMNVRPKSATKQVGVLTGKIAAQWLEVPNPDGKESTLWWDPDQQEAQWSGWSGQTPTRLNEESSSQAPKSKSRSSGVARKRKSSMEHSEAAAPSFNARGKKRQR